MCFGSALPLQLKQMKPSRNFITPYITWTFVALSLTGLLMLFHIADGFTEVVHELLGLIFVIITILHVIINWKALKTHFGKKTFSSSMAVVFLCSFLIIYLGQGHGETERIILTKLSQAPLSVSMEILGLQQNEVEIILSDNGIEPGKSGSIEEISIASKKSPKEILELLLEEK